MAVAPGAKAGSAIQVRRIVLSGYYGFHNSGDEAVLKSILFALKEEGQKQGVRVEPVVLSIDPEWTSAMYGVEAVHRMRPADLLRAIRSSHGLISGGGSLLQDATGKLTIPYYTGVLRLAKMLRKPTFVYAQGIGPVNNRWMDPFIRGAMKRSSYVSVRDAESAELLERIGVPRSRIDVVPDPVMGLPLPDGAAGNGKGMQSDAGIPVVGVSLRYWRSDGADLGRAAVALGELARSRTVRLRFLPFHTPADAEASRQVIEQIGEFSNGSSMELAEPGDDPQQMLLEVSRCTILFGMRLHALIYAANQKVPMLGLSYDPKIDQFLNRLGLKAIGTTEALDPAAFANEAARLIDCREEWLSEHGKQIDQLVQEAKRPAQHIVEMLR